MDPVLGALGLSAVNSGAHPGDATGAEFVSRNPATGSEIARVRAASAQDAERVVAAAAESFARWRLVPAPQRGEVVRRLGQELRAAAEPLARLVSLESGKILSEARGEVQEMIDMCDFAVGLSRQLYGLTMHSERPEHRMYEQWHPLGPVAVITAFNFPVAVWAWNAAIGAVCGDTIVWKPSSRTPLAAVAVQRICDRVEAETGHRGIFHLLAGPGAELGETLLADRRLPLVSATGSCRLGRRVAEVVGARLGRTLLELGGNNAAVVMEDADLDLAVRAITFAAVGTAGQRCTSLRRLFAHESIARELTRRLAAAWKSLPIGDPLAPGTLVGPLIHADAVTAMQAALARARTGGAEVLQGGGSLPGPGHFVEPALVRAPLGLPVSFEETFAPILYLFTVRSLDEAIAAQNAVSQGLSSAIFTRSFLSAERFLSAAGSDCGIANVNIGTSGAEIGGAFGGEKDTGGGREAGSDAWKAYMRRQTCTLNWGTGLPLAQGVEFL